jgi:hypothetical protein
MNRWTPGTRSTGRPHQAARAFSKAHPVVAGEPYRDNLFCSLDETFYPAGNFSRPSASLLFNALISIQLLDSPQLNVFDRLRLENPIPAVRVISSIVKMINSHRGFMHFGDLLPIFNDTPDRH